MMRRYTYLLYFLSLTFSQQLLGLSELNDTTKYTILFADRVAGEQLAWSDNSGNQFYFMEYNDRGRGPSISEQVRVDENGIVYFHRVDGKDYLKDWVRERYNLDDDLAKWQNKGEEGEFKIRKEKPYYVAFSGSQANVELLIKALRKAPNNTLSLLPSGTAKLSSVLSHQVGGMNVHLVAINGLGFIPSYVWVDDNDNFFATISGWFRCIKEGYESFTDELSDLQEKESEKLYNKWANDLVDVPDVPVAFTNVSLFDSEKAKILPNYTVIVARQRIFRVGPSSTIKIPKTARVINAKGKTILPGLWDMHVHISESQGILHLAGGVTNSRDMGNDQTLRSIKQNIDRDSSLGPEISVMAGFIDKNSPFSAPTGAIIDKLSEGFDAIREYKRLGYRNIKLYSSIPPEWVKPLADTAHSHGMFVGGHIPAFMTAEAAVKAGYDEITHSNMLLLNFLPDTIDTRTPLRFTMVAEKAGEMDLNSEKVQNFIKLLQDEKVVVDPTIAVFENMFNAVPGEPGPGYASIINRLPVMVRRGFLSGGLPKQGDLKQKYNASVNKMLEMVKLLHDSGIVLVAGTDGLPGFTLHRELELYAKAGIPAAEVLKIATYNGAMISGMLQDYGTVSRGKYANFILVDGDPTQNISDIRNVELTIKKGRIYESKKLYEAVGVGN